MIQKWWFNLFSGFTSWEKKVKLGPPYAYLRGILIFLLNFVYLEGENCVCFPQLTLEVASGKATRG